MLTGNVNYSNRGADMAAVHAISRIFLKETVMCNEMTMGYLSTNGSPLESYQKLVNKTAEWPVEIETLLSHVKTLQKSYPESITNIFYAQNEDLLSTLKSFLAATKTIFHVLEEGNKSTAQIPAEAFTAVNNQLQNLNAIAIGIKSTFSAIVMDVIGKTFFIEIFTQGASAQTSSLSADYAIQTAALIAETKQKIYDQMSNISESYLRLFETIEIRSQQMSFVDASKKHHSEVVRMIRKNIKSINKVLMKSFSKMTTALDNASSGSDFERFNFLVQNFIENISKEYYSFANFNGGEQCIISFKAFAQIALDRYFSNSQTCYQDIFIRFGKYSEAILLSIEKELNLVGQMQTFFDLCTSAAGKDVDCAAEVNILST